jgi:hypothetical protein
VLKLKVTGLKVLQNKVDRAIDRVTNQIAQDVVKQADYIEMRSRSSAPLATGVLKSSQFRKTESDKPKITIKIGFRAKYAPYQEFGTGNRFRLNGEYSEFADLASKFKTGRKPRLAVKPRRYFLHHYVISRRALSRSTSTLMKNLFK